MQTAKIAGFPIVMMGRSYWDELDLVKVTDDPAEAARFVIGSVDGADLGVMLSTWGACP